MSSTFRSHFRHAPQTDGSTVSTKKKAASKSATTSRDDGMESKHKHTSRLMKRSSKSIPPPEKSEQGSRNTRRASTVVTAAPAPPAPPRKSSVTPSDVQPQSGQMTFGSRNSTPFRPPTTMPTPSLVSGSSASSHDSPRSTNLRRKPSTIGSHVGAKRPGLYNDDADLAALLDGERDDAGPFRDTVLGISFPTTASPEVYAQPVFDSTSRVIPSARETPLVMAYAPSTTPSTRYTDSPFSHIPTPSSASSYSSSVMAPVLTKHRSRQPSPTRSRQVETPRPADRAESGRGEASAVRGASELSTTSTLKPPHSGSFAIASELPPTAATAPPPRQSGKPTRSPSRGRLVKERPRKSATDGSATSSKAIPPELAHLNVDVPAKPSVNKAPPPHRPSRDNTPNLSVASGPSPVVQSDLPKLYTTYHKRTPSQETPASPSLKSRFGISSRSSSRQPSPRIDSAVSSPNPSRNISSSIGPDSMPSRGNSLPRKDSPAVGPSPSPSKSPRFGFFSRKPKEMTKPAEKPKRQPRKGPAAGTGHEGYGRFGFRGRSGSTTSSAGLRSPSTDSNTSTQSAVKSASRQSSIGSKGSEDLDDFLKERLNPVYLRGSGSASGASTGGSGGTLDNTAPSAKTPTMDSRTAPQLLPSAMHDDFRVSPAKPILPSESDPPMTEQTQAKSTYTFNERAQQARKTTTTPAPPRINTNLPHRKDYVGNPSVAAAYDSRQESEVPAIPTEGKEGLWLRERVEAVPHQTHRWNFLQRAQASPKSKSKGIQTTHPDTGYNGVHARHADAHYAMLGAVGQIGLDEVARIARESVVSLEEAAPPQASASVVTYQNRHNSLLPSPPGRGYPRDAESSARALPPRITVRQDSTDSAEVLHAQRAVPNLSPSIVDVQRSPIISDPEADPAWYTQQAPAPSTHAVHTPEITQVPFDSPSAGGAPGSPRQPRLSPVGRIPQVVSKRDRERKLSDTSFSRPFIRTQPRPSVKPPGSLYSSIRELASPIEPSSGSQPVSSTSTNSNNESNEFKTSLSTHAPSASIVRTSLDFHCDTEFFTFPPRKDSDLSFSTSSGHNSYLAPMMAHSLYEDEVWGEFNDLMDEVLHHATPLSTGSSLGAPFHYSDVLYDSPHAAAPQPLSASRQPPTGQLPTIPGSQTAPTVLSIPQQISRMMQPSMSPSTPHTLADFYDQYGNPSMGGLSAADRRSVMAQSRSSLTAKERNSHTSVADRSSVPQPVNRSSLAGARASMTSSRYSRASSHSRSASLPEANAKNSQSSLTQSSRFDRDPQLLDIAEVDGDDRSAAANLRFGALMTSKWLSNGRVLFSPAHNEMRLADEPRVLIIDGLGSDWSFYVALSYPAATVYNLGSERSASWPGVSQPPPPNHRHITHATLCAAFPFPKGFFTAVVFRFPSANNDEAFQACITECKRVLRPGGHLEVTALDLDLNCMGNRARRAVRGLKTRMQQQDSSISLRNTSDSLLRIIGRRGFEEVQRCVVGVPAAGRIPRSQDASNRSSQDSGKHRWNRESIASQEFSFADLLEDARANQMERDTRKNDEGITKTVAKVGRWWYSSSYERCVPKDHSIWNDQALLRECEKQGTSFKLLICHAQKPTQSRRRTVSV